MQTLEDFQALLRIDEANIDRELLMHSDVMFRIIRIKADKDLEAEKATEYLKRTDAACYINAKGPAGEKGGPSDTLAKEHARLHPKHVEAAIHVQQADLQKALWEGLLDAWKQKGHALREYITLVQMQWTSTDPAASRRSATPAAVAQNAGTRPRRSAT